MLKLIFFLSRIKRAVLHRADLRTALRCALQRHRKVVKFTGIAAIQGIEASYVSIEHFLQDIPAVFPRSHSDYLVAQQFLNESFMEDPRPKVFFSREPLVHHSRQTRHYLERAELADKVLSFGEEDIERRMFYVVLPNKRNRIIRKLRNALHQRRPGLCCMVNRYKENDRFLLLRERINFINAFGRDIDIFGRADSAEENGWLRYPNYRGPCADKLKTLNGYTFNLCFENNDEDGYITEKIIHALMAGCVPLYWGGGRFAEQTIPASCFVNCKDQDPVAVYRRVRNMPQDEILGYRQAGLEFLASPQADRFTWGYWARLVKQRLLEPG